MSYLVSCLVIAVEATPTGSAVDASTPRNELDEENLMKRQERLASAFRDHMRDGQSFDGTGQYRREFFEEVTDRVDDVSLRPCLRSYVAHGISEVYSKDKRIT